MDQMPWAREESLYSTNYTLCQGGDSHIAPSSSAQAHCQLSQLATCWRYCKLSEKWLTQKEGKEQSKYEQGLVSFRITTPVLL